MRRLLTFLVLALGLASPVMGEVIPKSLTVSQTVTSYSFPARTRVVLIVSDGANTCFYRLFHDAEVSGNATASATGNLQIKSGESKTYVIGTQGPGTAWRTLSAICSTGESATWRIESF